ncbi:hypothetical protein J6590_009479 [Homalodisca vitripennis]|nr:hypothetical protein J6590_009479 [Homalodisca vitripennis]
MKVGLGKDIHRNVPQMLVSTMTEAALTGNLFVNVFTLVGSHAHLSQGQSRAAFQNGRVASFHFRLVVGAARPGTQLLANDCPGSAAVPPLRPGLLRSHQCSSHLKNALIAADDPIITSQNMAA